MWTYLSCLSVWFPFVMYLLHHNYTFVLVPRLATCTNIRMSLSLCKWTVFTNVHVNANEPFSPSSPLIHVGKPLREQVPRMVRQMTQRMTRRICDSYARHSPRHSYECVNALSCFSTIHRIIRWDPNLCQKLLAMLSTYFCWKQKIDIFWPNHFRTCFSKSHFPT